MSRQSILSNKSKVEEAVKRCFSVKECLEYLGLRAAGGNYKHFYHWCEKHDIVPPKGNCRLGLLRYSEHGKIPLANILITGSSYNRLGLKRRLIKERLLEEKCDECGISPEWNNKHLCLQLDHINGSGNDNRIENLRLLCPNCHSQTETFAGRRKSYAKIYRYSCSQCYASITKFSTLGLCRKCASIRFNLKKRKVERPSKQELEILIWSKPTTHLAQEFGVSDKAIEKWCKSYGIEKPPRGYWAKKQYAKL
jgi:Zn finger protein HypA/HybF involved in hydrogenase expression